MSAWRTICWVGLLVTAATAVNAQEPPETPAPLESLLRASSRGLTMEDGELTGPGAAFLAEVSAAAQFVALGEQHNNLEIPQFTTALFRLLQSRHGFQHLILEQDPAMMRRVSRSPVRGSLEAVRSLARRYPHGFTFISDQELEMISEVTGAGSGRGDAIWGCEQAFGVTHILDELLELAPEGRARAFVATQREKSGEVETQRNLQKGHYLVDNDLRPVVAELRSLFAAVDEPRVPFLIDAIAKSDEIYGYYAAGERGEVPGYFSNNAVREEYMKSRCLEEYRLAVAAGEETPKAILKFGHWHLFHWMGPARITTVGNLMKDFALINGLDYFSIAMFPFNAGVGYGPFAASEWTSYLKPFRPVAEEGRWTLVDLRPFREFPAWRQLSEELTDKERESLSRLVYGFDAALLLGGSRPATFEVTGVPY